MKWTAKKKSKFYKFNSKRRIISLMHSSILRRIWLNFMAFCFFGSFTAFPIFSDFKLYWPEHHWRDFISRNGHLMHQNWYRISFIWSWVPPNFAFQLPKREKYAVYSLEKKAKYALVCIDQWPDFTLAEYHTFCVWPTLAFVCKMHVLFFTCILKKSCVLRTVVEFYSQGIL
jgi:hypothetical protein